MDEKEKTIITVSSFITHPSYFLSSLRASMSPCLASFISIGEKVVLIKKNLSSPLTI